MSSQKAFKDGVFPFVLLVGATALLSNVTLSAKRAKPVAGASARRTLQLFAGRGA